MSNSNLVCEYIYHESGIHEFIFHEASRATVDEFITQNNRIVMEAPPGKAICYLIDISPAGPVPMGYFIERVRHSITKFHHRPEGKIAVLYRDKSVMALMLHIAAKLARQQDTIKFFGAGQRIVATKWLLENNTLP